MSTLFIFFFASKLTLLGYFGTENVTSLYLTLPFWKISHLGEGEGAFITINTVWPSPHQCN